MKIKGKNYRTIWFDEKKSEVNIIDQTKLPHKLVIKRLNNFDESVNAIKTMEVRGAPLIGGTAAYGITLAIKADPSNENLRQVSSKLLEARPTAVNLKWAVDRMNSELKDVLEKERYQASLEKAKEICDEDVSFCKKIGEFGKKIIEDFLKKTDKKEINILTHCNAGWLATIDWGTATSPIYRAFREGIKLHVWVDETRPRNQGASITSFELNEEGIPNTIIADNTGGLLMQKGMVDLCITGADRVTANGDVANKIGTYLKALAAHANNIPFYVALPSSTIDWSIFEFKNIPIEERSSEELSHMEGIDESGELKKIRIYPKNSKAFNLAFDITPAQYVTSLITERGVCTASNKGLRQLFPNQ